MRKRNGSCSPWLSLRLVLLAVAGLLGPAAATPASTIVRFSTEFGNIDVRLFGEATPASIDNFLDLIGLGVYDDTLLTRSVPGFVIQGGGFRINEGNFIEVAPGPPVENLVPDSQGNLTGILNEPGLANIRGTLSYARSSEVDSATNQWFFNTENNRANLDFQNGGFTAFGQVLSGLEIVDQLAALPAANFSAQLGASFTDTPLTGIPDINNDGRITTIDTQGQSVGLENFVTLNITQTTFDTSDFNLDNTVDLADYELFRSQFGNTLQIALLDANSSLGTELDSDGNGDAIVTAADYALWRASVGATSAAVAPAFAVPEPATAWGIAFATSLAARRRRRS